MQILKIHSKHELTFPLSQQSSYEEQYKQDVMHDDPHITRKSIEKVSISFLVQLKPLYPYEKYQIQHKSPMECRQMVGRSNSINHCIHMIKRIDDSGDDFQKKTLDGQIIGTQVVKCTYPQDVDVIEVATTQQNYNTKRQNKFFNSILKRQDQHLQ